jgi:hypothetical protein
VSLLAPLPIFCKSLTAILGNWKSDQGISVYALKSGPQGLRSIYHNIIGRFIDTYDMALPDANEKLEVIKTVCESLAFRLRYEAMVVRVLFYGLLYSV